MAKCGTRRKISTWTGWTQSTPSRGCSVAVTLFQQKVRGFLYELREGNFGCVLSQASEREAAPEGSWTGTARPDWRLAYAVPSGRPEVARAFCQSAVQQQPDLSKCCGGVEDDVPRDISRVQGRALKTQTEDAYFVGDDEGTSWDDDEQYFVEEEEAEDEMRMKQKMTKCWRSWNRQQVLSKKHCRQRDFTPWSRWGRRCQSKLSQARDVDGDALGDARCRSVPSSCRTRRQCVARSKRRRGPVEEQAKVGLESMERSGKSHVVLDLIASGPLKKEM